MNRQNAGKSVLVILEALLLCVVLVFCIVSGTPKSITDNQYNDKKNTQTTGSEAGSEESAQVIGTVEYTEVRLKFSEEVEAKLSSMTKEEKVAQLFLISAESLTGVEPVTISGNGTKSALEKYPVGGLVYDGDNFLSEEQIQHLTGNAQLYSMERMGVPLFIGVAEEGGIDRSPLARVNDYEITLSPGELGAIGDAGLVTTAVNTRMTYLKTNGFNMVFGAMTNLGDGNNAYQDDRTYGMDSAIVSEMITADVTATNANDITSILRYFPRQGNAGDFSKITQGEIDVFQAGIDAGAKVIMVSHGTAKAMTGDANLPCSMAEGTVATLRAGMGFEGILITTSLDDQRITTKYSAGEAAVNAISAGMDMLFEPENFVEAYDAVLAAVNDGTISEMRLDNAVGRILELKMK